MPLENVGVQIFVVPAVDGFEEISMVALAAFENFDPLALLVAGDRAAVIRHDDVATFAVNNDSDAPYLGNFQLFDGRNVQLFNGGNSCILQTIDALLRFALLGFA